MTLVALFAMTAGAWADDLSESFTTNTGASVYTGEHFKITPYALGVGGNDGFCIEYNFPATIEALNGEKITKVEFTGNDIEDLRSDGVTVTYNANVATVSDVNATSLTIYAVNYIYIRAVKVYYTAGPEVTWNASSKTGTFSMPGSDVVLTPVYAPAAAFATTGTEPNVTTLAPTAAEGVIAGTDAPLIVEGTVAAGQGTVMYFATTEQLTAEQAAQANGWLSTLPTAANIADDGATVYVWYYIKGTDTPDGQEATAENTFNDSEICAQPLEVIVLSNKFDITFNAANANTIEAGKATVKVGDAAATVTEGKLQGVKMGTKVTINAKQGYKFRKVEAKKKAASLIVNPVVGQIIGSDGKNYDANATLPDGVTAVAVIAYVGSETGDDTYKNGLAIALADEGSMNWSTAISTCEGKTPTVTGAKWCLPSQEQWKQMFKANGGNDARYTGLNATITTAGGYALKESTDYWSSSEADPGAVAYRVNLDDSDADWYTGSEGNNRQVRACLAF